MLYQTKLLPMINSLRDNTSVLPFQNITIPYITPLVELLERKLVLDTPVTRTAEEDANGSNNSISLRDCDELDVMLAHLDTARLITQQCGLYQMLALNVMKDFQPDRHILDMFTTEVHLRLLWGAKGAGVVKHERYTKFNQVLTVLSERVEPSL